MTREFKKKEVIQLTRKKVPGLFVIQIKVQISIRLHGFATSMKV